MGFGLPEGASFYPDDQRTNVSERLLAIEMGPEGTSSGLAGWPVECGGVGFCYYPSTKGLKLMQGAFLPV